VPMESMETEDSWGAGASGGGSADASAEEPASEFGGTQVWGDTGGAGGSVAPDPFVGPLGGAAVPDPFAQPEESGGGDPFAPGGADPFAPPASQDGADPFADPVGGAAVADPFAQPQESGSGDPFAPGGADPFGPSSSSGGADPFASPGSQGGADPFASPGSQGGADPFATGGADPFASPGSQGGADPFATGGADPFASPGSQGGADPFASPGSQGGADPFATGGADPFASPGSQGGADPFATGGADPFASPGSQGGADPFATGGADPFASPGSQGGADPFASPGSQGGADPFATPGSQGGADPFATGGADPFATPGSQGGADPFATGGADPFAAPEGQAANLNEGAWARDGQGVSPQAAAGSDAPIDPRTQSTFFVQGAGGGAGQATEDEGARGVTDDLFDVDMPASPSSGARSEGDKPRRARSGRRRGQGRKKEQARKKRLKAAAIVVGVVVAGGLALGLTDVGVFGVGALSGSTGKPVVTTKPRKTIVKKTPPKPLLADDVGAYVGQLQAMRQRLKKDPNDAAAKAALVDGLVRLRDRYPSVFKDDPSWAAELERLATPAFRKDHPELAVFDALAKGAWRKAADALEGVPEGNPWRTYLAARVALAKGAKAEAVKLFQQVVEAAPKLQAARVGLAQAQLQAGQTDEARATFEGLLAANAKHTGALLGLAEIALGDKRFSDAERYVRLALDQAKAQKDRQAQFRAYRLGAAVAKAEGKPKEEIYSLDRALELMPRDEDTALKLHALFMSRGKPKDALDRLEKCERAGCSGAEFSRVLVESYIKADRSQAGLAQLTKALERHPSDTGLLMLHADFEKKAGRLKSAKFIYQTIIDKDPSYNASYLRLAELQSAEGMQRQAITTLERGIKSSQEPLPLMEKLAQLQMASGATLKAKETMRRILEMDPRRTDVKERFAKLLLSLGLAKEAEAYYRELADAKALSPEGEVDFADALFRLKRYGESLEHVENVLKSDPDNLDALVLRGGIRAAQGQHKLADSDLRRALKIFGESARAYHFLGLNEASKGSLPTAAEYLAKAADLAPKDFDARADLARVLTEIGGVDNRKRAIREYTVIIRAYGKFKTPLEKKKIRPDIYLARGRLYLDAGKFKAALNDFRKAMSLDPGRDDLIIQLAATLRRMERYREAQALLSDVLKRAPEDPAANYELALIALKRGQSRDAERYLRVTVAQANQLYPDAHRYLGYLYKDKGVMTLACAEFRAYLQFAPEEALDRREVGYIVRRQCRRR